MPQSIKALHFHYPFGGVVNPVRGALQVVRPLPEGFAELRTQLRGKNPSSRCQFELMTTLSLRSLLSRASAQLN
jgi:hypothetical protein